MRKACFLATSFFIILLGVEGLLSGYYCPTFQDTHLKKTDYILLAMADYGVSAPATLMVGDTKSDISAAKEAGVESVGVTYGFAAPGELEEAGADFFADDAKQLYFLITGRDFI